jgi:hypothetical protein
MWRNIRINGVGRIEKCVGEFKIWIPILPYAKMKVKVYQREANKFIGRNDILLKRRFDGSFEGAIGYGSTVDEALEDVLCYFMKMVEKDYPESLYPHGIQEDEIQYAEASDF